MRLEALLQKFPFLAKVVVAVILVMMIMVVMVAVDKFPRQQFLTECLLT